MNMTPGAGQPDRRHNALALLPPQAMIETSAVLKRWIAAHASSEIENIVTTADKLFRHAREEEHADPATQEALRSV